MSVVGKGISLLPVFNPNVVAAFFDWSTRSTERFVGEANSNAIKQYDTAVFDYDTGVLTCKKAGEYEVSYMIGADLLTNSSGITPVQMSSDFMIYKNDTLIESGSLGTLVYNQNAYVSTLAVTLAKGDTFKMGFRCQPNVSNPNIARAGFAITPQSGS